jgi:transposase InsO family protein
MSHCCAIGPSDNGECAKRAAVAHLVEVHEMSERRACHLIGADRSTIRYRSRRPDDADLRDRLRELAGERRRFGYRRLHVLLRQEGLVVNRKKTERIYREEKLTVRRRRGRKKATGTRAPILVEAMPNARWSVDFVHDQLVTGRRLRILNVVDDVTKECLAAVVDTSISGKRVARELGTLVARRGKPGLIVSGRHRCAIGQSDDGDAPSSRRTPCSNGPRKLASPGISSPRASRCRTASAKRSTAGCATSF